LASTKADNNRVSWVYVDDDDETYAISAKAVYVLDNTDGTKYGGEASSASHARIPKQMKPRRVKCIASGKPDKWVIAYSIDALIWTSPGTALTLDCNGVDTTYATTKYKRGEKSRDTTRQTA
jgi:hypothetical protein